jgi:hypothetical protein
MHQPDYTAFYCEENIWRLDRSPVVAHLTRWVVFISNARRAVPTWSMRASGQGDEPVVWDYHVVLLTHGESGHEVWDLDFNHGAPVAAEQWLAGAFPVMVDASWRPVFRVIPSAGFQTLFSSDRRHMRDAAGQPIKPFPSWPAPYRDPLGHNLMCFVDMSENIPGEVMSLTTFSQRVGVEN